MPHSSQVVQPTRRVWFKSTDGVFVPDQKLPSNSPSMEGYPLSRGDQTLWYQKYNEVASHAKICGLLGGYQDTVTVSISNLHHGRIHAFRFVASSNS